MSVSVFTARCYASAVLAVAMCLSVRPSVCLSVCLSVWPHGWDASNSFSAVAECLVVVNTHQESVAVIFDLRANASWDSELLLLCYLGARRPYVIVAANVPVQLGLWVHPALTDDTAVAVVVIIPVQR